MKSKYDMRHSLNSIELMMLIHTVPIAVGVLGMVRFVAQKAGHDAVLSTLLGGVYLQASVLFMWLLLRRFQRFGIYEIHQMLFGKWIGKFLNLLFAAYCLLAYVMVLRTFTELVTTWMFPMTPVWLLTGLFLVPIVYLSAGGIRLIGRFAITVFILTIWIVFMCYYPMQEGGVSHLFPIGANGFSAIFQGSIRTALSLLGVELLLTFYPYVVHKKDVLPAASIGAWATAIVYTINAAVSLIFFTVEQLEKTIWPMLTMFKHVQMPFIERFETIMMAVWILRVVNSSGAYLWAGVEGLMRSFRLKKAVIYVVLIPATLWASQMLKGRTMINMVLNQLSYVGLGYMLAYPLLLWIVSLVMRKKGDAV